MYATNTTLNIIDSAFSVIEVIAEHDYVQFGEKVINISAVIIATAHAVISYFITAVMLWWLDNGDAVMTNLTRFTFNFIDTVGVIYLAGVNSRPVINRWVAQLADRVYFTAIAL